MIGRFSFFCVCVCVFFFFSFMFSILTCSAIGFCRQWLLSKSLKGSLTCPWQTGNYCWRVVPPPLLSPSRKTEESKNRPTTRINSKKQTNIKLIHRAKKLCEAWVLASSKSGFAIVWFTFPDKFGFMYSKLWSLPPYGAVKEFWTSACMQFLPLKAEEMLKFRLRALVSEPGCTACLRFGLLLYLV